MKNDRDIVCESRVPLDETGATVERLQPLATFPESASFQPLVTSPYAEMVTVDYKLPNGDVLEVFPNKRFDC